jgi:hypothetical protein
VYAWIESGVTKREGTKKKGEVGGKKTKKRGSGCINSGSYESPPTQQTTRNFQKLNGKV